jgi:hypothetical protein
MGGCVSAFLSDPDLARQFLEHWGFTNIVIGTEVDDDVSFVANDDRGHVGCQGKIHITRYTSFRKSASAPGTPFVAAPGVGPVPCHIGDGRDRRDMP